MIDRYVSIIADTCIEKGVAATINTNLVPFAAELLLLQSQSQSQHPDDDRTDAVLVLHSLVIESQDRSDGAVEKICSSGNLPLLVCRLRFGCYASQAKGTTTTTTTLLLLLAQISRRASQKLSPSLPARCLAAPSRHTWRSSPLHIIIPTYSSAHENHSRNMPFCSCACDSWRACRGPGELH